MVVAIRPVKSEFSPGHESTYSYFYLLLVPSVVELAEDGAKFNERLRSRAIRSDKKDGEKDGAAARWEMNDDAAGGRCGNQHRNHQR